MAAQATLAFTAQHPVRIDWGDGSATQVTATSPAHHLYSGGAGPWTVTLTDTIHAKTATAQVNCTTCTITGAQLAVVGAPEAGQWSIGPVSGATGPVQIGWGDTTTSTIASGQSATHTYAPAAGSGPFTVTATDTAVPGCAATVTAGNAAPNKVYIPATITQAVTAGKNEVCITLAAARGEHYVIAWGDGNTTDVLRNNATRPWQQTLCHTFPGGGGPYLITVTEPGTPLNLTASGTITAIWATVTAGYPSWTGLAAANPTWADVLNG